MQNNVCSDIFLIWVHAFYMFLGEGVQILNTKYMENCEALRSSTHSFAFISTVQEKCSGENYENSTFHILFFFRFTSNIFTDLLKMFYSFYWINLNRDWISGFRL